MWSNEYLISIDTEKVIGISKFSQEVNLVELSTPAADLAEKGIFFHLNLIA